MTPGELAALLDCTLLEPGLDDEQVVAGIRTARRLGIASVTVRPCDIDLVIRTVQSGAVRPGAVCGFPHGSQNTATKLFEARDLLRRGARDIAAVIGTSRLLSREFQHVQTELLQLAESCHKEGAQFTVILEPSWLTDELKVIVCACAERAEADFVCAGTGFAPGWTAEDLRLLRKHLPEEIGLQAMGGIRTLDQVLEVRDLGCSRISTPDPTAILDEWAARQAPPTSSPSAV